MSFLMMQWAYETPMPKLAPRDGARKRVSRPTRKAALAALAFHYNEDTGRCDPGTTKLAEETHLSPSTISRARIDLQDSGLIVATPKFTEKGLAGFSYSFARPHGWKPKRHSDTPRQSDAHPPSHGLHPPVSLTTPPRHSDHQTVREPQSNRKQPQHAGGAEEKAVEEGRSEEIEGQGQARVVEEEQEFSSSNPQPLTTDLESVSALWRAKEMSEARSA